MPATGAIRIARAHGALPVTLPEFGDTLMLATGDWDNDGRDDLVGGSLGTATAWLARGQGDGTFHPAQKLFGPSTNDFASMMPLFDLDRDGARDAVFGLNAVQGISIGWGGRAAGLAAGVDAAVADRVSAVGNIVTSIQPGDFDGNGRPDVAVLQTSTHIFGTLRGTGTRQWTMDPLLPADGAASQLAVADFNRDGLSDIVAGDAVGTLTLYVSLGDGTFTKKPAITAPGQFVVTRDFTRDASPDLVSYGNGVLSISSVSGANLAPGPTVAVPEACSQLFAGDTDGDGLLEALLLCNGLIVRVPWLASGAWGTPRPFSAGGNAPAMAVGRFDAGMSDDVVVSIYPSGAHVLRGR